MPSLSPRAAVTAAILVLVLAAAALVRVVPLTREAMDPDELFSIRAAKASFPETIDQVRRDLVHPPLFYLVLKTVAKPIDLPEEWLRGVPLVFGLLLIVSLAAFGIADPAFRAPAIAAAGLLAVNDLSIFYSQQVRSYSLYALLVFLLFSALARWPVAHWKARHWLAAGALSVVAIYTHYMAALYLVSVLAWVIMERLPRAQVAGWLALLALTGGVFLFWLLPEIPVYRSLGGLSANLGWHETPGPHSLRSVFAEFSGLPEFRFATSASLLLGICGISGACFKAVRENGARQASTLRLLFILATLPPLMMFLLAIPPVSLPIFGERQVLPSCAFWIFLSCIGLWSWAERAGRLRRAVLVFGLLTLFGFQIAGVARNARYPRRVPYNLVAAEVRKFTESTPVYTTYPYGIGAAVNHYLPRPRVVRLPAELEKLPSEFVLLYRPHSKWEQELVDALRSQGWQLRPLTYVTNRPELRFGTEVAVAKR